MVVHVRGLLSGRCFDDAFWHQKRDQSDFADSNVVWSVWRS